MLDDFLERIDLLGDSDEPYDVPGNATWQGNQILFRPIGQRRAPGKGDQLAVGPRREESGHGPILSSTCKRPSACGSLSKLPASRAILREAGSSDQSVKTLSVAGEMR